MYIFTKIALSSKLVINSCIDDGSLNRESVVFPREATSEPRAPISFGYGITRTDSSMLSYLHIEAIMLAVARWSSGNQRAASLVGAKMMSGWAPAQRHCPTRR